MVEWFASMNRLEFAFTLCAIIGGLLFLLRFALQLFGGGDVDVDGDIPDLDVNVGDTDSGFSFMSLHGVTVFLLMFGLIGRALLAGTATSPGLALAGATVGGLASVWGIAQIYLLMRRLQSSGNVDINNAVGAAGTVYLTIPAGGAGQVQVSYQGQMHIDDAYSEDGTELKTGEKIDVVAVRGGNTLVVRKAVSPGQPESGKDTAT